MNTSRLHFAVLFTGLLGLVCTAEESEAKVAAGAQRKVMSVEEVSVKTLEIKPAQITVEAAGTVNSGGWVRPALVAVKSDAEGVLVFHFVAIPPSGPATAALAPVKASITVEKPANFREVQVVAQVNTKTAK
ncbi:MAG: hypothetical protein K8R23_05910 [Chthoniobacter sp.]|nr:hypothetical protein [Chthoniobacter sp.]